MHMWNMLWQGTCICTYAQNCKCCPNQDTMQDTSKIRLLAPMNPCLCPGNPEPELSLKKYAMRPTCPLVVQTWLKRYSYAPIHATHMPSYDAATAVAYYATCSTENPTQSNIANVPPTAFTKTMKLYCMVAMYCPQLHLQHDKQFA